MSANTQILYIGGGETFDSYDEYIHYLENIDIKSNLEYKKEKKWKDTFPEDLGGNYDFIKPEMPSKLNAKYLEWKIIFEKYLDIIDKKLILIGHSLGGIFLTKYLSENNADKDIIGLFLITAPFDDKDTEYTLADFELSDNLSNIENQVKTTHIYHSEDDPVVPFSDLEKYLEKLPNANSHIFLNRGHFNIEEFPEIIEDIKSL